MLSNLLDEWFRFPVGEGAFYAAFGFLFVFTGIVLLILIFTLLGFVMSKINAKRANQAKQTTVVAAPQSEPTEQTESDVISDETVAVIAAALTAYYAGQKTKCDFVVKRIKRL